jgi:hypothetical protein
MNSANQREVTKIQFSDWLFDFCNGISKFLGKQIIFTKSSENLVILGKFLGKFLIPRITRFSKFYKSDKFFIEFFKDN